MFEFIAQHASEIWTFIAGLFSGAVGGSLITLKISKNRNLKHVGSMVDQNEAHAGGDIVGRDKTTSNDRRTR